MSPVFELIPIPCTEHEKLSRLRSLLIEIQAAWFGNSFGSGETFSTPEIWEKMQEAVCLMHQSDDPSKKGIDLKAIASNYELLEQIFIARHWETNGYVLDDSSFVGCDLIQMHRFSALGILRKVDALHQSILVQQSEEKEDRKFKEALSKIPEGFEYKDYLVEPLGKNRGRFFAGLPPINSDRTIEQRVVDSYSDEDGREDGGGDESPGSKFMTELHKFANFDQSDWQALEGAISDPTTQIIDEDGDTPN